MTHPWIPTDGFGDGTPMFDELTSPARLPVNVLSLSIEILAGLHVTCCTFRTGGSVYQDDFLRANTCGR